MICAFNAHSIKAPTLHCRKHYLLSPCCFRIFTGVERGSASVRQILGTNRGETPRRRGPSLAPKFKGTVPARWLGCGGRCAGNAGIGPVAPRFGSGGLALRLRAVRELCWFPKPGRLCGGCVVRPLAQPQTWCLGGRRGAGRVRFKEGPQALIR